MNQFMKSVTLLLLLTAGTQNMAAEERAAQAELQLQQTIDRLELTEEQIEQARPILLQSQQAQRAVLASYGIDLESGQPPAKKLGLSQARAMQGQMDAIRQGTLRDLKPVLSDKQLDELQRIQAERRDEVRARIRAR